MKLKTSLFGFFEHIMAYYAVARGRKPGIYLTWDECKSQVYQFSNPKYKKFPSKEEASAFINGHSGETIKTSSSSKPNGNLLNTGLFNCASVKRSFSTSSDEKSLETSVRKRTKLIDSIGTSFNPKTNKEAFVVNEDGFVEVYTDGACSSNGGKSAKAGIGIWFSDNHPMNVSRPVIGRATNNMAEIQAVTIAAQQAQKAGVKKLKINTDSKFLISCITQWMKKWKLKGWKTANGQPVINKAELLEMEKALAPLTVQWNHVRGHVGLHGNEAADKLARAGALSYQPN